MKTLATKSGLLFGAMLAVWAFAVPATASAVSFTGLGTHQLFSPNLSFATDTVPFLRWSCADSQFDTDIVNGADALITRGRFQNCRGLSTGTAAGCTITATGTNFPWTATPTATANIQIFRGHVVVGFEALPGTLASHCLVFGMQITLTGTLNGASWNSTSREITLDASNGVVIDNNNQTTSPITVTGTLRDLTGTLGVIM
ncbi:MAG TPA: hypothetical protein VFY45_23615 [Baekduia sp.]|nr:hypothetical protein [Baekduia sp.]